MQEECQDTMLQDTGKSIDLEHLITLAIDRGLTTRSRRVSWRRVLGRQIVPVALSPAIADKPLHLQLHHSRCLRSCIHTISYSIAFLSFRTFPLSRTYSLF